MLKFKLWYWDTPKDEPVILFSKNLLTAIIEQLKKTNSKIIKIEEID